MKFLLLTFLAMAVMPGFAPETGKAAASDAEDAVPVEAPLADEVPAAKDVVTLVPLPSIDPGEDGKVTFYVIPVREQIAAPILYIVRSGVKEAITAKADCIILDLNTPGGSVGTLIEIMEILERFPGTVVTYVNHDAISAGALLSAVTERIYLSPKARIGDAGIITAQGEDVPETMRVKLITYLNVRIRSVVPQDPFRGEVVRAMMDNKFEFSIGEDVIRPKDGLFLALTAPEAMKTYGDPARPLLGTGIIADLPTLYKTLAGPTEFDTKEFKMTWSLDLAFWLMNLSPILLGIGGLMLAIEFKTPGFGWIGGVGIALLLIVFFGHNVAGLSGHEPMLFFLLGVALVFVEILILPGTIVFGALGALIMLGSLLWGMADIWPKEIEGISFGTFFQPAYTLSLGLLIGVALFLAVMRFLPQTPMWSRLVLAADIHEAATTSAAVGAGRTSGEIGVVVSPLRPTGTIEIRGERFEARSDLAEVAVGVRVRVVRRADFVLIVEPVHE